MALQTRKVDASLLKKVNLDEEEEEKCIIVSNIPSGTTEQALQIHLMKTKHGGGDIESVQLLDKTTAAVIFEERDTVDTVLSKEQDYHGNILKLECYLELMLHKLTPNTQQVNKSYPVLETLDKNQATRSIVVRNLPPGIDEQIVTIHFQKQRHGGGDIDSVKMLGKDTAVVIFDEHKTVGTLLARKQVLKGKELTLIPYVSELPTHFNQMEEDHVELDFLDEKQASRSVVVNHLPPDIDEEKVIIYFQKRKYGGGDIDTIKMLGGGTAVVTFDSPETVETTLSNDHELSGNVLKLDRAHLVPPSVYDYEVCSDVTARLNMNAFSSLKDSTFNQVMKQLQRQHPKIKIYQKNDKHYLTGPFLQVQSCRCLLQNYFSDKDSFWSANKNSSHLRKEESLFKDSGKIANSSTTKSTPEDFSQSRSSVTTRVNPAKTWNDTREPDVENLHQTEESELNQPSFTNAQYYYDEGATETAETANEPEKLQVQTYDTTPMIIRFIKKVYRKKLDVIEEEYSVKLSSILSDTKITIEPTQSCNGDKYNDACNEFIDLYQDTCKAGVTKNEMFIKPEKAVTSEHIRNAVGNVDKLLPVLVEKGQGADSWVIIGDHASVEEAKAKVQEYLGVSLGMSKGRRRRTSASQENSNIGHEKSPQTQSHSMKRANTEQDSPSGFVLGNNAVEHVSKTGIKISVYKGDITAERVDAIVNSANPELKLEAGLGGAIARAGGPSIQAKSTEYVVKHGFVKSGQVAWTTAGKLSCKKVIHAVGPAAWPGESAKKSREILYKAYLNSLLVTDQLKLKSIAIPAIGTGIINVPLEVSATQLLNAIEEFWKKESVLTDIRIVNLLDNANDVLKKEFINRFKKGQSDKKNPTSETRKPKPEPQSTDTKDDQQKKSSTSVGLSAGDPDDIVKGMQKLSVNVNTVSAASAKPPEEKCVICMDIFSDPFSLKKCGHKFCKSCIDQAFSHRKVCPVCGTVYGVLVGNQPNGTMNCYVDRSSGLPGYPKCGSIRIQYYFPDGTQGPEHPNPGQRYYGTSRTAYLPDCSEGREVLQLLRKAFDARLLFTVGTSVTTGATNIVTWNDIHHKTNIHGGSTNYGYPDPTYLTRVKGELAAKGIV